MYRRRIATPIVDLALDHHKMAFLSGPRQVGKTTMAKNISSNYNYFNWDDLNFRRQWVKDPLVIIDKIPLKNPLIILDEIHKAKNWKNTLKGIYDLRSQDLRILVTGSARLNIFRRGQESLLGRYFYFKLNPLSVSEITNQEYVKTSTFDKFIKNGFKDFTPKSLKQVQDAIQNLMAYGGFPEPFVKSSQSFHRLWQSHRIESLVREDLRDLSHLTDLSKVEMLATLLPERVGKPFSISSVREDLEVAHTTVTRWLNYLNALYYYFEIKPYSKSVVRSLKKEGKIYLYDCSEVPKDGERFENLVAYHLIRACDFWRDSGEGAFDLFYLRDKEKVEVDFLVVKDKKPWFSVEAKLSEVALDKSFEKFQNRIGVPHFQIVAKPGIQKDFREYKLGAHLMSAEYFLSALP